MSDIMNYTYTCSEDRWRHETDTHSVDSDSLSGYTNKRIIFDI